MRMWDRFTMEFCSNSAQDDQQLRGVPGHKVFLHDCRLRGKTSRMRRPYTGGARVKSGASRELGRQKPRTRPLSRRQSSTGMAPATVVVAVATATGLSTAAMPIGGALTIASPPGR